MSHNDYQMALLLQQQFEHESNIDNPGLNLVYTKKKSNDTKSLTDPSWELIDPTPDIHMLFMAFNEKYFWNKLLAVCVSWSKRMTTCAGICSYQGRGGMCTITLSEPLLKLRPRKDLVETLLHEMIHAYLFVTHNNRDRDGHGPEFHKHMYRINAEAGTNITVYHSFHDEVRLYQQHWWRCDGPCQKRKPYFGMVRRAMNRPPGPNDFWWKQHQDTCGGKFIKVKEPDKPQNKENKPASNGTIDKFIPIIKERIATLKDKLHKGTPGPWKPTVMNMVTPKTATSGIVVNKPSTSTNKPSCLVQMKITSFSNFSSKDQILGSSQPKDNSNYAAVRNHWINKFPSPQNVAATPNKRSSNNDPSISENSPKRVKPASPNDIQTSSDLMKCPVCETSVLEADINSHLDQCLQNQTVASSTKDLTTKCPLGTVKLNERAQTCVNNSDEFKPTEQESVPCLVCNKKIIKSELNVHLDDCMRGNNIFNNSSGDVIEEEDDSLNNQTKENTYNCPVCFQEFSAYQMNSHLDLCLLADS
ncbi:hypothetical protein ILUMI_07616 [Ignelater luminosus]|uniref:Protein with SprT-like domain at the N terminus n=1 Tax=Ignelater luminosus TaxID=2038154 RepID=A0A8K0GBE9_IGNLU|nr:hypothetical protein ILUMI_07616 [Ignelater luminosus]